MLSVENLIISYMKMYRYSLYLRKNIELHCITIYIMHRIDFLLSKMTGIFLR